MTEEYQVILRNRWYDGWSWRRMCDGHKRIPREEMREFLLSTGHRLEDIPRSPQQAMSPTIIAMARVMIADGLSIAQAAHDLQVNRKTLAWHLRGGAEAARKPKPVTAAKPARKCLSCLKMFPSEGPHNRICHNCSGLEVFGGLAARATAGVRAG
jgi:hypothetical protein